MKRTAATLLLAIVSACASVAQPEDDAAYPVCLLQKGTP